MLRLIGREDRGLLTRPSMAMGCELCFPGHKSVIFITGLCGDSCYYCPVGRHRLYHDVMYVNERKVGSLEEIVEEVTRSRSTGASITGGDPLAKPERTLEVIMMLKSVFGESFHIHLYTSGRYATQGLLKSLDNAGLDEIRFHPTLPGLERRVETALRNTSMRVGIEVPGIPGSENWLLSLARYLDSVGGHFMNVNELEVSEANINQLASRGFKTGPGGVVVKGSRETILRFMEMALEEGIKVPIHYCPASFKDSIQTRFRMMRTGRSSHRIYERVEDDGTVSWVEIIPRQTGKCREALSELVDEGIIFPSGKGWFLTHPEAIGYVRKRAPGCGELFLVRAHPTEPRLVIEKTSLEL